MITLREPTQEGLPWSRVFYRGRVIARVEVETYVVTNKLAYGYSVRIALEPRTPYDAGTVRAMASAAVLYDPTLRYVEAGHAVTLIPREIELSTWQADANAEMRKAIDSLMQVFERLEQASDES